MKKILCVLLAMAMVFALVACGGGTPGTPSDSSTTPGTPSGNPSTPGTPSDSGGTPSAPAEDEWVSLTVGVGRYLGRFLAGLAPTESYIGCDAVFDTVFRWDPYEKKIISNVLTSWEWEDDNTFVMHMRDDVYFSNGDNATAEDIIFSYLSHLERGSNYLNSANVIPEECLARDTYTAQFKLQNPYPAFIYMPIYLICKSWSEGLADGWDSEEWYRPVGSGPYSVEEWVNDSYMVLKSRGDDYWYKDEGPIVVDEYRVQVYPDAGTLYMALETGEVDLAASMNSTDYGRFLRTGGDGFDVTTRQTGSLQYFCFGFSDTDIWNDVRVREAIAIGVKWEEVGQAAFGDFYSPTKSIASVISPDYVEIGTYEYNPERAKQLLAEAGYGPSNPLTIETTTMDAPIYKNSHEVFEFYASQLGINAITHHVDTSTAIGVWISPSGNDFCFWSMYGGAPGGLLSYSLGFDVDGDGGVSFLHILDPHFRELYGKIRSSTDDNVRSQAAKELQQYAFDGFWRIPTSEETVAFGWRTDKLTREQVEKIAMADNHLQISRLGLASFWN